MVAVAAAAAITMLGRMLTPVTMNTTRTTAITATMTAPDAAAHVPLLMDMQKAILGALHSAGGRRLLATFEGTSEKVLCILES